MPAGPFWLCWAGDLPFAAASGAAFLGSAAPIDPVRVLIAYACVILSFMGGAQWGLATAAPAVDVRRFGLSVIPALIAWPALLLAAVPALGLLVLAFAALCGYDLWTVRQKLAPAWYGRLRLQRTGAVIVCLLAALAPRMVG